jgi:hypothetical protein
MEKNNANKKETPTILFVNKEKEPLFSKKEQKVVVRPFG